MSKFKAPERLSFSEIEKLKEQIDNEVSIVMDKLAIEHNNVLVYIKDKEKIVFDGNVHNYSYFLYELESDSLEKAKKHQVSLYNQYYQLYNLSISDLLLPGDYGIDEHSCQDLRLWERAQAGIVIDMILRSHLDRIIKSIAIKNRYKAHYAKFHDGMLAAGYSFHDKTIRKMASELISNIELQIHDVDIAKPDISKPISEKYYKASPFRKTPKQL